MSPPGRPKGEYRSAQHKGAPITALRQFDPAASQPDPGWFDATLTDGALLPQAVAGLPIERLARLAARRTFVALKLLFIDAASVACGPRADWLRHQVRQSDDPVDLWLLRGLLLDALPDGESGARRRAELQRMLDRVFPDNGALSAWRPLTR